MVDKNYSEFVDTENLLNITDDIFRVFGTKMSGNFLTKFECKSILNIIFESLFDEKLKTKNFNYIYKLIPKTENNKISKEDFEPIIKSFIVCFDVNYITNSSNFNDKVCIKIGKHLLPISYYIKKNE